MVSIQKICCATCQTLGNLPSQKATLSRNVATKLLNFVACLTSALGIISTMGQFGDNTAVRVRFQLSSTRDSVLIYALPNRTQANLCS